MPIVWDIATSKKVYFTHTIDEKFALSTGQYTSAEPVGAEDAYIAERAGDTILDVVDTNERARLGGPLSSDERDRLGQMWVDTGSKPLPT